MGLLNKSALIIGLALVALGCDEHKSGDKIGTEMIDIPGTLNDVDHESSAIIEFEQREMDGGTIAQGDILNFDYHFTNVGEGPLVISSVSGSCGCTIPKNYPKGKILPGEGGTIQVEFDSDNKWGEQTVSISVVTNTVPSLTQLLIRTNIVAPDNSKTNN